MDFSFVTDLLEGVEIDGLFPSLVGFSDEGFGSTVVVSVLVGDLVGDFVGDFVGDSVRDFSWSVSVGGVGSFVGEGGGVCVIDTDGDLGGEELGEIDGDFDGE